MRLAAPLLVIPLSLLLAACGGAQEPPEGSDYWPAESWRRAEPAAQGVPQSVIDGFASQVQSGAILDVSSLVIIRHGYVLAERYFNGSSATDVHTMQSVSKSVSSLVTGIAVDDGAIGAGTRLFSVLPEYQSLATDPRKAAITIGDLLAMRSGIDFFEDPYPGSPLERLNQSTSGWVRIALEPPMNAAPGTRWQYNSGGVIVLAAAVGRATGMAFDAFARDRLFTPLGITTQRWYRSAADDLPHAGGGLSLTATDLARVGYLVLRHGKWNGTQVVSEQWLAESMRPRSIRPRGFGSHPTDYGWLWWLFPINTTRPTTDPDNVAWTASGNLGQWLFVIPRYDLVVVVTGSGNRSFGAAPDFVFGTLLPAIR